MTPLRLNVLPEEKRRGNNRVIYVQFTKNILEILFIIFCVGSIVLLFGKRWLYDQLQNINSHTIVSDSKYLHSNQQIDAINKRLKYLGEIQSASIVWTPIMSDFASAVPAKVSLTYLSFDLEKMEISMSGTSETRDELLAFKNSLENLAFIVSPISIPVEQLTNKENVPFNFSVKIKR